MMIFDQEAYDVRCEWGEEGVARLAPGSDAVVIVDVLSFCTSVDVAVARGAVVYPYRGPLAEVAGYAAGLGAQFATKERGSGYSLSPASLLAIGAGERLVLPSPNGSTLTLAAAGEAAVLAGCLRNARAVAEAAAGFGPRVAVIPAGERWRPGGGLRPALEDWLGAGAILSHLPGRRSPEAEAAVALFAALRPRLGAVLGECVSGRELREKGFAEDVRLASALDGSGVAPLLVEGGYRAAG